jgi:hypothetical protein
MAAAGVMVTGMENAMTDVVAKAESWDSGSWEYAPLPPGVLKAVRRARSTDIPQLLTRMRQIQAALGEAPIGEVDSLHKLHDMTDGLACFNHLYQVITTEILCELTEGELFHDPEFLQELDLQFARRYFEAIHRYGKGSNYPRSWAVLFDRRRDERITPMQFAVAGVNTHVNFDLPFAVVETCRALGRPLRVPEQKHDYNQVNQVFFDKIPALRHHFEDRWQRRLDRHLLKMINNLVDGAVVVLDRNLAWWQAEHLWRIPVGEPLRKTELELDATVSVVNRALLTPMPAWARGGALIPSVMSLTSQAASVAAGRLGYRLPFVKAPRTLTAPMYPSDRS